MVLLELERRARRKTVHRVKLFVQILTTAGYACVGGALADPLFKGGPFGLANALTMSWGLAALILALYYVPDGEHDVPS